MTVQIEPNEDTGNAGDLTDVQSYSWIILDWVFNTLTADPYFENFVMTRAVAALPIEAWNQVPYLGIYLGNEPQSPDGAYNMGDIRLSHQMLLGFQIILRNNDAKILQRDLDRTYWHIHRLLLRSDAFTNRFDTQLPGGTGFNGITKAMRYYPKWGLAGQKNETPVGEQRFEWTLQFVTTWYAYGFDELKRIDVTTGFPGPGSTPQEREAIPQARMTYLFGPESVPTPLPPDTPPPGPPPGSPP